MTNYELTKYLQKRTNEELLEDFNLASRDYWRSEIGDKTANEHLELVKREILERLEK